VDVAFTQDPHSGRLTFARNADGDFYLDTLAVYPVIATLFAEKGRYLFDPAVGTYLSLITQDSRATGSRLTAAQNDALDQCRLDGLLYSGEAQSTKLRPGVWQLIVSWKPIAGANQSRTLRV